ncbi:MAG: TIGR03936 family radical SAM-associated protein [Anaerolineaceae bacterium]|nr:TIGR03936 family radical SAM-associated protein [Anaerolineaceae bacterium]
MNYRYRINYSKKEGMRYTSNLDIHKMWERTFRRAKLPLVYSQGFHPQPKIQQASPLPLGFLSDCEIVDFFLEQEMDLLSLETALTNTLPYGISVNSIIEINLAEPALQTQTIASEYHVFFLEEFDSNKIIESIYDLKSKETVIRVRRGKSYDLRPLILDLEIIMEDSYYLKMLLKSKDGATGRPEEVLSELNIPVEFTRIIRKKIIMANELVVKK